MQTVTAFDAKTRFGELLDRVAKGEEVVITRYDKPVARLVPEGAGNREAVQDAVGSLRDLRRDIAARLKGRKAKLSDAEVRSAIEEGRE